VVLISPCQWNIETGHDHFPLFLNKSFTNHSAFSAV
jgi:hypothetical protein